MKGKALRKHSPHGKIAASVFIKIDLSVNTFSKLRAYWHNYAIYDAVL